MEINIQEWSEEECLSYVLVNAAESNFEITIEEKEKIREFVSEELYKKSLKIYTKATDYENVSILLDIKGKFYQTPEKQDELLEKIKSVLYADGEEDTLESIFFMSMRKMLKE